MTGEQRLDRLERIVRLMITAGTRARRQSREQDEKINILIDMQMKNDERYEKRFVENEERLVDLATKTEEKFAALAESQKSLADTVERIITERRNGNP